MSTELSVWEELAAIQDKLRDFDKAVLSLDELIMLVLYAQPDKPIKGKTVFVEEIFIIYDVFFKKNADFYVQNGEYYASESGPYSDKVVELASILRYSGLLVIENDRKDQDALYSLTKFGRIHAEELFLSLPEKMQTEIIEYRKNLDELGHKGILAYVQEKYENYIVKSVVKSKRLKIEWGFDFE
ncbi:hypothetical protein MmiHf6_10530 [Methanimicrococcus hongohii]|uniref:Uncharacterized protein n=1 Tax=Methanimicrococcus hongohii TaxID=3028295 RepID=A0AA97A227_9EURY|nr:hypothetical protein [Methanimicrococcus sp. Hf6]WNY23738.1 hypothetical protein MmiHf6_10530 [Methanimicrococcus sp. Hf6]